MNKRLIVAWTIMLVAVIFVVTMLWLRPAKISPPDTNDKEILNWHVMGDRAHMSFRINKAGNSKQDFRLDAWLPTDIGAPINVAVQAKHKEDGEQSVPINLKYTTGGPDPYGFEGFDKYTYEAEDNIINGPGEWEISVKIIDSKNQVHSYEKTFKTE